MATSKRSSKRRDPLVACNQEVLTALMKEQGVSVARLAKRAGELEQTLAHLIKTPGARCQRSRLKRIARALSVPPEMLTGDPYAIAGATFFPEGFEYRYSARTALAASRLLTQISAAIGRDLTAAYESAGIPAFPPRELIESAIRTVFLDLIMISEWRKRFIHWSRDVHEARGYLEPAAIRPWEGRGRMESGEGGYLRYVTPPLRPEKDPEHEAALLGIMRGIEHIFAPWFDGAAQLDYRAVRDFVHLPAHPFVEAIEQFEPTSPLAALDPNFMPRANPPQASPTGGTNNA